jgi:hypothetical protein
VRDEDIGQRALGLEVLEQVEHLGLHGLVEGGHRLVEDEQPRVEHEGARDVHPLALPAGELVGVAPAVEPRVETHAAEERAGPLARLRTRRAVHEQAEGHGILDGQARVQRGVRILEHELHVPAQPLHARGRRRPHVLAVEPHHTGVRLDQPQEKPRERRLAASGLAHDAERLARRHVERDAVHRPHPRQRALEHAAPQGEMLAQALHLEERPRHPRISMASRRPSESRLNAIDVRKMARPGRAGTRALT